jgi:ankyrin repeat domain-containing protein 50
MASPTQLVTKAFATNPAADLRTALDDFNNVLTDEERVRYRNLSVQPAAEHVIQFIKDLDKNAEQMDKRNIGVRVGQFAVSAARFFSVADTVAGYNAEIGSLVWGGLKFSLTAAGSVAGYRNRVSEIFMEIGILSSRLKMHETLHTDNALVQAACFSFYAAVVRLYAQIVLSLRRSSIWAIFTPADAEFADQMKAVKSAGDYVKEASTWAANRSSVAATKATALRRDTRDLARLRHRFAKLPSVIEVASRYLGVIAQRMPHTAEWFVKDGDFLIWSKKTESTNLLCYGSLGCGKSIIMASIVEHLVALTLPDLCVCYYFCIADDTITMDDNTIVRTIAHQMLQPFIHSASSGELERLYNQARLASLETMEQIVFERLVSGRVYVVVVDGLDQCTTTVRGKVLKFLHALSWKNTVCIKIALSTRNGFEELANQSWRPFSRMTVSAQQNSADIQHYVDISIDNRQAEIVTSNPDLIERIRELSKAESEGNFLWVRLFLEDIYACHNVNEIRRALDEPPKGIRDLTNRLWSRARASELAERLVQRSSVALRPFTIHECKELLSIEPFQRELEVDSLIGDISKLVRDCHGLLFIEDIDESVHIVHHSVQTHLFNLSQDETGNAHRALGFGCLTYLTFSNFKRDIIAANKAPEAAFELPTPTSILGSTLNGTALARHVGKRFTKVSSHARVGSSTLIPRSWLGDLTTDQRQASKSIVTFPFLDYASMFWVNHLQHVEADKKYGLIQHYLDKVVLCVFDASTPASRPWQINQQANPHDHAQLLDWALQHDTPMLIQSWIRHIEARSPNFWYDFIVADAVSSQQSFLKVVRYALASKWFALVDDLVQLTLKRSIRSRLMQSSRGTANICQMLTALAGADNTHSLDVAVPNFMSILGRRRLEALQGSLSHAAEKCKLDGILILRAWCASDEEFPTAASFALRNAAASGSLEIVNKLLKFGADVNDKDPYGCAALQTASAMGHLTIVQRFIEAGANVNATDSRGWSALSQATTNGHVAIQELLIGAGASPR